MYSEIQIALSNHRLETSSEKVKASGILLQNGMYKDSIGRSYYAIFSATRALLALDCVDFSKHAGVIAYFQKNYVKEGLFEKKYSKIIQTAFQIRNRSDYDDYFIVSKDEAQEQLNCAQDFLEAVKKYINSILIL